MWCAVRDKYLAAVGDWMDYKLLLLYLGVIILFIWAAYQTYYKYILPRLNPSFVPNREFIHGDASGTDCTNNSCPPGHDTGHDGGELMFFCVKWCPHCKRADPEWQKIVDKFSNVTINGKKVFFKKIDCEDEETLADKYKIEGYPTIKLVKKDRTIEYNAKPNAKTLEQFLMDQV